MSNSTNGGVEKFFKCEKGGKCHSLISIYLLIVSISKLRYL